MNERVTDPRHALRAPWQGRVEDDALLRGLGRFGDDIRPDGAVAAVFVRSPYAFAKIRAIDVSTAKTASGVAGVFTGVDVAEYQSTTSPVPIPGRGGRKCYATHCPALAAGVVRHAGEAVAMVVANTPAAAQDAAELVTVDYESQIPVTDLRAAVEAGAPQLWTDAPGNIGFDWEAPPDAEGTRRTEVERAFASAAHVARVDLINQRLVVASIEPRVASAEYDAERNLLTLRCGSQGVSSIRMQVMAAMQLKPEQVRVITEDVGGAFGMKGGSYPEYVALLHAARALRRPVHWASSRSEAFLSDMQGRDSFWHAELAIDANGKFLALRVDGLGNLGAYATSVGHFVPTLHVSGCLPTVYDIPLAYVRTRCVFTNTVPTGPYRGAGRPEANYLMERLVDEAARVTGIDPVKLRKRNMIIAKRMPYQTPFGNSYDSGEFPAIFDEALKRADFDGFRARRKQSRKAGKLRGIGVGCYLEIAGAYLEESANITFRDGAMQISIASGPSGQSHRTVFQQLAAARLGIPETSVTVVHGDTARDVPGFSTVASRSAMMVGSAIVQTIEVLLEKGRKIAALLLQAGEADIQYRDGAFHVGKSGRQISLFEVAERAGELVRQSVIPEGMNTKGNVKTGPSFPNGCHIAEVEIDPDTGALSLARYTAVDDCGRVLNEVIAEAQLHGGIAQGFGQALIENTVYDDNGQLLSGSFMDYGVPRAHHLPDLKVTHHPVPCKTNPVGAKGTGEAGTTAAPPTIINAILNALPASASLDMPATPERIWHALRAARM